MTGEDGARSHLFYDPVGSLCLVVDGQDNVVKEIQYDAFGNIVFDSNPGLAIPLGFAGGLHDPDTGLVRFGFRDYDPTTGRWIAKDPIGFGGGDTDLYGYTENNPINNTDPFGLWYIDINVSFGYWGGGTGGIIIGLEGIYPYAGGGVVSPPGGVAVTWSPSDPTPGWNVGVQGGYWAGFQYGYSFEGGGDIFWEVGFVTPGFSVTGYHVWEPWRWPWKDKEDDPCE